MILCMLTRMIVAMSDVILDYTARIFVLCRRLTKPTATRAEPVFQPTKENWLENQYSGRLYLSSLIRKYCTSSFGTHHVHVLSSSGVGSRSLLDHFAFPMTV